MRAQLRSSESYTSYRFINIMCMYISCLAFCFASLHVLIGLFRLCRGGGVGFGLRGAGLRSHNQDIDDRTIVEKGCFFS